MPRIAKRTTAREHIDRIGKRIVKKFHPQQIILFGSHARRGRPGQRRGLPKNWKIGVNSSFAWADRLVSALWADGGGIRIMEGSGS